MTQARIGWCGLLAWAVACGGGGEDAAAPAIPASGSDEARAQQKLCAPFEACGGELLGGWEVAAVCFENPEVFLPASSEPDCEGVVRGAEVRAAGRYDFDEDVRSVDLRIEVDLDTVWTDACIAAITGDDTLLAADVCLDLQEQYAMQPDIAAASCALEGDDCACLISTAEASSMTSGGYSVSGDMLGSSPYCVDGDLLRISMTAADLSGMGLVGTVVLRREEG